MLTDDIHRLDLPIEQYYERLLDLLSPKGREASIRFYTHLFGDPDVGYYTARDVRLDIIREPFRFFTWVSATLGGAITLTTGEANRIADEVRVVIPDPKWKEYLRITGTGLWQRELPVDAEDSVRLSWYAYDLNDEDNLPIVPEFISDNYIRPAVLCYGLGLYPAALVLASMAFEATLSNCLERRNEHKIPVYLDYEPAEALVKTKLIEGALQALIELSGTSQPLATYFTGARASRGLRFRIRRRLAYQDGEPPDGEKPGTLSIEADTGAIEALLPHTAKPEPKCEAADGFRRLRIAARRAKRLHDSTLPVISDKGLNEVRNKLAHGDERELNKELIPGITVRDFISRSDLVRTALIQITTYISSEFDSLRAYNLTVPSGTATD